MENKICTNTECGGKEVKENELNSFQTPQLGQNLGV